MYDMYLDEVLLPITPSKLQMKIKNQNKTFNLINDTQINILRDAGLTEISFDFVLPMHTHYPFARYTNGFQPPDYYTEHIKVLKTEKKSFHFKCIRHEAHSNNALFFTNLLVAIEDYTIEEDASDGPDVTVSIKLKQYIPYQVATVNLTQMPGGEVEATVTEERPAETAPVRSTHTVVKGDCLWNIAKKYLGDGSRYMEIYNLNQDKIQTPNLIYPGQVLILPT